MWHIKTPLFEVIRAHGVPVCPCARVLGVVGVVGVPVCPCARVLGVLGVLGVSG